MINNRQQNGRRRGRGGNNGSGNGGGGQRSGNLGRPDSGNRIDSRARGNASQLFEKYRNMARDSQMSGDRVNTEYYLQFADHYFRVLSESRSRFEDQQPQPRRQSNDSFDAFDGDDDYGDEGDPIRAGEQSEDARGNQRGPGDSRERDGREREARDREGRDRDSREPRAAREPREGRPREATDQGDSRGQRDNRDQRDGAEREPRRAVGGGSASGGTANGGTGNGGAGRELDERPARIDMPVANDLAAASVDEASAEPRRGRRPRRDRVASVEDDQPVAIEADRLPPPLTVASVPEAPAPAATAPVSGETDGDSADEQPKPRRRRLRTVNGSEAPPVG